MPSAGIGLARLEFVINNLIGIHPKAVLQFQTLPAELKAAVLKQSRGYADPLTFYVEKLTEGISTLAAAFWPRPVIVRLSDFKSNEYRKLLGGELYEPLEENPMMGFRGAGRYVAPSFRDCFELECRAMKKVRDGMGYTNVEIMVPFVRTVQEAREVVELLAQNGLKRGENGLRLIMMCEIPSNALLAEEFLQYFDGFSIGSNDLTQLTLGLDRDSSLVANRFDERDAAVKKLLEMAISTCNRLDKYVGICGQGPSDHFDFALWLMDIGIQSMSLNPDTLLETWRKLGGGASGEVAVRSVRPECIEGAKSEPKKPNNFAGGSPAASHFFLRRQRKSNQKRRRPRFAAAARYPALLDWSGGCGTRTIRCASTCSNSPRRQPLTSLRYSAAHRGSEHRRCCVRCAPTLFCCLRSALRRLGYTIGATKTLASRDA